MERETTTEATVDVFCQIVADDDPDVSWLEQTPKQLGSLSAAVWNRRRLDAYRRGDWYMVGVRLAACVTLHRAGRVDETFTLSTPGVWNVESDSGEEYFRSICADEREYLADDLAALKLGSALWSVNFEELEVRER